MEAITKNYDLQFFEHGHKYVVDGIERQSATTILGEYIKIKIGDESYYVQKHTGTCIRSYIFERAGFIGTHFHLACKYYIMGTLDYDSLDIMFHGEQLSLRRMMNQFIEWHETYKPRIILMEEPLYSMKYEYTGTPDIFLELRIGSRTVYILLDLKSGMFAMVGPQLAAYEQLVRENLKFQLPIDKYVLSIPKNGRDHLFKKIEGNHWDYFKLKLYEKNYLQRLAA